MPSPPLPERSGGAKPRKFFFLLFVITASWGLIWALGKSFWDTIKDGLGSIGKSLAERFLKNVEQQGKISEEQAIENAVRQAEIKRLTDFESRYPLASLVVQKSLETCIMS